MSGQRQLDLSIRKRVKEATLWVIGGHFTSQFLRLASNLVMTRLLVPEMFGVMAVAGSLMAGLALLSDLGIRQNIIQNHKGNDAEFLNTAWSLNIIRGVLICSVILLISVGLNELITIQWLPNDSAYASPILPYVLAILSVSAIFNGFESTKLATANRELLFARITLIGLLAHVAGLLVMIGWALVDRSIWALVAGGLVGSFMKMAFSHLLMPGNKNYWHWNSRVLEELISFGKWIFLATMFTFLGGKGISLMFAVLISVDELAFIVIAGKFAWAFGNLVSNLSTSVVFPVFSDAARRSPQDLAKTISVFQSRMLLVVIPLSLTLSFISQELINFLYDDRYNYVGHYLGIMALNGAIAVLPMYYQNAFLAMGNSKQNCAYSGVSALFRVSGVLLGYLVSGVDGMLYGLGAGTLLFYFYVANKVRIKGWLAIKSDTLAIFLILAGYLGSY